MSRQTWESLVVTPTGLMLHAGGCIIGGRRFAHSNEIPGVRDASITYCKPAGVNSELSAVADAGHTLLYRFDGVRRTWLQKLAWQTLTAPCDLGPCQLLPGGSVRLYDGTILSTTGALARQVRHGGTAHEIFRLAGSRVIVIRGSGGERRFGFDAGQWHRLVGELRVAVAIFAHRGPIAPTMLPPSAASPPDHPPVRWRRYPLEDPKTGMGSIGEVVFLNDGGVVLGTRTFVPGSEVENHAFAGHVANRTAETGAVLVIDKPDGESMYFTRQFGTWYRLVPMPGNRGVLRTAMAEDVQQAGWVLAILIWAIKCILGAVLLTVVAAVCTTVVMLVLGQFERILDFLKGVIS